MLIKGSFPSILLLAFLIILSQLLDESLETNNLTNVTPVRTHCRVNADIINFIPGFSATLKSSQKLFWGISMKVV